MTDKQLAIKVVGILGSTKICSNGEIHSSFEYSAEYTRKCMQEALNGERTFYGIDKDFVEAVAKGEIEANGWTRSSGWFTIETFLYGSGGRESVFEEVFTHLQDFAVRDTYAKLAEIGSIDPQTNEELSFYIDLYFGENEKKAA